MRSDLAKLGPHVQAIGFFAEESREATALASEFSWSVDYARQVAWDLRRAGLVVELDEVKTGRRPARVWGLTKLGREIAPHVRTMETAARAIAKRLMQAG